MKIRFIHQYFHPDRSAVSRVISQVAFHVAALGHEVSVICSRNRYDPSQSGRLPGREKVDGVEIHRCWGPSFGKRSLTARTLDMISFCLLASGRALFSSRADVVVLLTNPPFFSAIGSLLKRFRRERFVYVLMDIYPDVAIRGGVLREGSLAERALRRLARFTLKEADVVVVLGENMKTAALRSGAIPSRVRVIPNWADPDRIFPVPAGGNNLRRSLGLDGKFVVEYSGNMGVSHSFGDLLAVIEEMQVFEDIRFVFIGGGERRPEIDAFVRTKRLENVVLLPYQDDTALPQSLSMGDVHYVSLREGFEGLVFPSKVYGIMAAGRPLIYQGTGGDDVARMVVEGGMGVVVRPGDKDGLREAIFALYRDREGRLKMGENGRRALVEKYSAAKGLDSYRKVLEGED